MTLKRRSFNCDLLHHAARIHGITSEQATPTKLKTLQRWNIFYINYGHCPALGWHWASIGLTLPARVCTALGWHWPNTSLPFGCGLIHIIPPSASGSGIAFCDPEIAIIFISGYLQAQSDYQNNLQTLWVLNRAVSITFLYRFQLQNEYFNFVENMHQIIFIVSHAFFYIKPRVLINQIIDNYVALFVCP